MSTLFHLTGLTLFSAHACFASIYFHKNINVIKYYDFSPVLIESARGKSSPVCHAFQIGFIYYYILNPIQGGLFEPPFWGVCVCVCVFLGVCVCV